MPTNPDPTPPPSRTGHYAPGGLLANLKLLRDLMQQLHGVMGDIEDALGGAADGADEDEPEEDEQETPDGETPESDDSGAEKS